MYRFAASRVFARLTGEPHGSQAPPKGISDADDIAQGRGSSLRRRLTGAGGVLGALGLLAGMLQVATVLPASAATTFNYVVNSTVDGTNQCGGTSPNNNCSLNDAAITIHADSSSADTYNITFAAGSATYPAPATANAFDTAPTVNITGNGVGTTFITGSGSQQVFLDDMGAGPVSISNLTIEAGHATSTGADVYTDSQLSLTNVLVTNGVLTSAGGNGGGIYVDTLGVLTGSGLSVTNNTGGSVAGDGGGIDNLGIVKGSNFTVSSNASSEGGGISNEVNASVNVTGLTMSLNSSQAGDGGAVYNVGTFTATGVNIFNNSVDPGNGGGGIANELTGILTIGTSTVAGGTIGPNNHADQGGAILNSDTSNVMTLWGVNISQNMATAANGGGIYNVAPLVFDGSASEPSSLSMNSAATGDGGGLYNDFEAFGRSPHISDVSITGNTAVDGGGIYDDALGGGIDMVGGSLSDNTASTTGGGAEIGFTAAVADTFSNVTMDSNKALGGDGGAIAEEDGGLVINQGTTITNNVAGTGVTSEEGGALYLGSANGASCTMPTSPTPPSQLAPYNVCIDDTMFSNNTASTDTGAGGAIDNHAAIMLLTNSTVTRNTAGEFGGGINNEGATAAQMQIVNSTISDNELIVGSGTQQGAGIVAGGADNNIYYSTISGNFVIPTAAGDGNGGGLYVVSPLTMINDTVTANTGVNSGGGMYVDTGGVVNLGSVTFASNEASNPAGSAGGAIDVAAGSATTIGSIFSGDEVSNGSGGFNQNECMGTVTSDGYNLDSGTSCGFTTLPIDKSGANADLGPLQNNGGAAGTDTMALGSLSAALNGQAASCEQYAQNSGASQSRPSPCDIGAYQHFGNGPSFGPSPTQTVNVSANPNSTTQGTNVNYTATVETNPFVASPSPAITGTVTFDVGGQFVCSSSVGAGGAASCSNTNAPVGTGEAVTASYGGDGNYSPSAGNSTMTVTAVISATSTSVGVSPGVTTTGSSVSYSATVTGGATPTGSVTFKIGATTLCTATLSGGSGSCSSTGAPIGTSETVTGTYSGDGSHSSSAGSTTITVNATGPSATSTSVGASPSSVTPGTTVTYSATVTGTSTPTGSVTFSTGATTLCSATLVGGVGSCTATNAPLGVDVITGAYSGDGTHSASSGSTSLTVGGDTCLDQGYTGNAAFVCQVFVDLLGRFPSSAEDASWVAAMAAGTSRTQVGLGIADSQEYRSNLVNNYYMAFLGRPADAGGFAYWIGLLNGGATDGSVLAGILGSAEFYADSGSTPAGFITALYHDLLNRAPDGPGLAFWENQLSIGATRAAVAGGILGSTEYLVDFVAAQYIYLLGRGVDPAGLTYWVGILASTESYEAVISGIIGSPEYYLDATT